MNTNLNKSQGKSTKPDSGFSKGDILLGFFLLMVSDILALFLPKPLVVALWVAAALLVIKHNVLPLLKNHRFLVTAEKTFNRIKVIAGMRDDEFDERFAPRTIPHTSPAVSAPQSPPAGAANTSTAPFMPSYACKQEMSAERAMKLAKAWWQTAGTGGATGAERVEDLIQQLSTEKPGNHTAILTEYADWLELPTDELVLAQLIKVVKADGLAAELSENGDLIILWGQDESGREAGMG